MSIDRRRIAIIVDPTLAPGLLANTVAVIGIGLGAVCPELGGALLVDHVGRSIHTTANRPVPVLQASKDTIRQLLLKALPPPTEAFVIAFPQFARSLHTFADYEAQFPSRNIAEESVEGVGLIGLEKWLRSLTGNLKLLR